MSAEVVNALEQRAHQLDAEADNASSSQDQQPGRAHPSVLRFIAQEFRALSLMVQGKDPAREEADRLAHESTGGSTSGLAVQRTDESGAPVPPPPDAGQQAAPAAAMPQSGATEGQPGPSYPQPGQ